MLPVATIIPVLRLPVSALPLTLNIPPVVIFEPEIFPVDTSDKVVSVFTVIELPVILPLLVISPPVVKLPTFAVPTTLNTPLATKLAPETFPDTVTTLPVIELTAVIFPILALP